MDIKEFDSITGGITWALMSGEGYGLLSSLAGSENLVRRAKSLSAASRRVFRIVAGAGDGGRLNSSYAQRCIRECASELSAFSREVRRQTEKFVGASGNSPESETVSDFNEAVKNAAAGFSGTMAVLAEGLTEQPVPETDARFIPDVYIPDYMFRRTGDISAKENTDPEVRYSELFPNGEPGRLDVIQTEDKACFLMSSLAAMAGTEPDAIKNMIRDNDDGTVTVRFYGRRGNEKVPFNVCVDKTLPQMDSRSAPWVQLIEKAYAASGLRENYGSIPATVDMGDYKIPRRSSSAAIDLRTELDGGAPQMTVSVLTGENADRSLHEAEQKIVDSADVAEAYEKTGRLLLDAAKNGDLILINTSAHSMSVSGVTEKDGKVFVSFYDQRNSGAGYQTAELKQLLDGNLKVYGQPMNHIQINKFNENGQIADSQEIYLNTIASKVRTLNSTVSEKDLTKHFLDAFAKFTGFDGLQGYNEQAQIQNSTSARRFAETDPDAVKFLHDTAVAMIAEGKTLRDVKNMFSVPGREIFDRFSQILRSSAEKQDVSGYLSGDVKRFFVNGPAARNEIGEEPETDRQQVPAAPGPEEESAADAGTAQASLFNADYMMFARCAGALQKAKTFYNSDEYNMLIDAFKTAGSGKKVRGAEHLDDVQTHALKLLLIKKRLDNYLDHKGRDGVKQNVYRKLLAVEKCDKLLAARISQINPGDLTVNGKTFRFDGITADYAKMRKNFLNEPGNTEKADLLPVAATEGSVNAAYKLASAKYPDVTKRDIADVNSCMCKIILRAVKNGADASAVEKLDAARLNFIKNPSTDAVSGKQAEQSVIL